MVETSLTIKMKLQVIVEKLRNKDYKLLEGEYMKDVLLDKNGLSWISC